MLALCLAALFALAATTAVVASPALGATCNEECKKAKELEAIIAKEKRTRPWEKFFGECPTAEPKVNGCLYGVAGPESFYQAGKVTVHFVKPVVLQGGTFREEEPFIKHMAGALNKQTIVPVAEPTESLNEGIDAELLPEPEKKRYEEYIAKGGSTKVTATTELAGPAENIVVNTKSTLEESNESENAPAFTFQVMIHLKNKFLGEGCYVGTPYEPVVVPFYTGETSPPAPNVPIKGHAGTLTTFAEGSVALVSGARLVNNSYPSPGVHGCGVYGKADAALNAGLGLPSPAGSNTTELVGEFQVANSELVEEAMLAGPGEGIHYYAGHF
jgi:hypothetical protein